MLLRPGHGEPKAKQQVKHLVGPSWCQIGSRLEGHVGFIVVVLVAHQEILEVLVSGLHSDG